MMKIKMILVGLVTCLCLLAASSNLQAQDTASKPKATPQSTPGTVVVVVPPTPAGWKTYEFKYGEGEVLSLILPREPQIEVEKSNVDKDMDVITHIITSESPSSVFVAGYIELVAKNPSVKITPEIRKELSKLFWGFLAQGMQEGMKEMGIEAKLTPFEMKTIMVYGREGQEQDFLIGKMPGRYRAVIGERHIYMLLTFSTSNENLSERDVVVQSFKISPAK
jgi:hypothetical protein